MFKAARNSKNFLNSNNLIIKSMYKRRKLACAAIAQICDRKQEIRVIK